MTRSPDIRHEIRVAAVGEHFQAYIREGMPEVGWDGDPWLTLAYNKLQDRWEVWAEYPSSAPQCVMRSKPFSEGVPSIQELCIHLRDHDLRKISSEMIEKRIDDHNLQVQAAAAAKGHQQQAAALEKVYWYAGKELGERRLVISMHGNKS